MYDRDISWLSYAVHELPAGVLYGANGASPAECADMMTGLEAFEALCVRLGRLDDQWAFIEGCRWHFEHYPHYLGRRRHFANYETYIRNRNGPLTVPPTTRRNTLGAN